ncbi:hypothetical protein KCP77_09240 [Salmonella enterica subsp. enterica]|nr:hypothetical protein KCP77_09240 [Salmonella enterica subsp. enterica]
MPIVAATRQLLARLDSADFEPMATTRQKRQVGGLSGGFSEQGGRG